MWQPQSIAFTNLFSHAETTFHFKQNEMSLLLGINQDKNGSNSNGSGKSTLVEAITLSITSDTYRKVSKTEFIRAGQKDCVVIFTLQHSVTQELFRIERQFFRNTKSSTVRLFEQPKDKQEKELTQMTNPNEANKYIFTKLGIFKEDFLNYFVIGQGNPNSFFNGGDLYQKAVIARFSNYERIDRVLAQLKNDVDELIENLRKQNDQLFSVTAVIDHIHQEIKEQNTKFEENKKLLLEAKQVEIDSNKEDLINYETKITQQSDKIIKVRAELKALVTKVKDTEALKAKLAEDKQLLTSKQQELKEINNTITELNKQSGKAVECPKCGEVFIPDSDLTPEQVAEMLELVEVEQTSTEEEIEAISDRISEIRESITSQSEVASQIRIKNNEVRSFEEIKQNYQNQLESKVNQKKNLLIEFQVIKSGKPTGAANDFKSKLQIQMTEKQLIENQIKEIEDQVAEKQFFQYHFGKAGLKTYLANKSIKAIQDVTNYHLEKLETNLQVKISGYKVLKSGEVRDQIETKVITDGIYESLFNAYSGGEKQRIDACGAMAINFMINNNAESGGLNLIVFDERSDLDSQGQVELIKTLAKLEKTCILVLHHVDELPYKNKVYVEKKNKISRIIEYVEPKIDAKKLLQLQ